MDDVEFLVVRFALCSRFCVILLQVVFNVFVPDHDAKVFTSPVRGNNTAFDDAISSCLEGFSRWDAQYFLHIAQYGYTYENTLAFFPLFPISIRFLKAVLFPELSGKNEYHCMLLIGVTLNVIFFCMSAVFLQRLTNAVFKSKVMSFIVSMLFCINPASIFFSACYSESLFCMLTLAGLWLLEQQSFTSAALVLGMSAATRSNGIISFGFILYAIANHFYEKSSRRKQDIFGYLHFILLYFIRILVSFAIFIIPFSMYQIYSFLLYCTSYFKLDNIVAEVSDYAFVKHFKIPGDTQSDWCSWKIPLSYSYVQTYYWNVGFLQYYELKQMPNFLLAAPLLFIILVFSLKYFQTNMELVVSLGLKPAETFKEGLYNEKCFVYVVHALFICMFCLLFIHIQVTTRLVASSSPVLYWFVANLIICDKKYAKTVFMSKEKAGAMENFFSLYHIAMRSNVFGKLCFVYFLSYFVVGIIMHVNYLPWT